MPVTVREITRAAPDILRILVIDEAITKYPLVELTSVDASHPTTSWVQRNNPLNGDALEYCKVIGDGTWLKFADVTPTSFLNRDAALTLANYPDLGTVSPSSVYLKTMPNDQGKAQSGTHGPTFINCRHEIFLKYDGNIPDGQYTMAVTGSFFPSTDFVIADKVTRSDTIRATQVGHKPTDPQKIAHMSVWIPGAGSHGAMDLDTDYSIVGSSFYVINEAGTVVFTGTIALGMAPTTQEDSGNINLTRYTSTTGKIRATATKGNPTSFQTDSNHGFSNGEIKDFLGFSGLGGNFLDNDQHTITVTGPDTFTVAVDTSSDTAHVRDTYPELWDSWVFDTVQYNKAGTWVYDLDYSAFQPTAGNYGKHRIYVPGFGVSWPFEVDPAARYVAAKNSIKGFLSQCWGMSLSWGQVGWNRPFQYRDGRRGQVVYEASKTGIMDGENSSTNNDSGEYLFWDGEVSAFTTRNQTITGGTSGATGSLADIIDDGASGHLILRNVSGTFQNNETITGSTDGEAVVDTTRIAQQFDAQTGAFTTSLTVTGGTSGATGVIDSIEDNGNHGVLFLSSVSGVFEDGEALTDTSTGSATAHRAPNSINALSHSGNVEGSDWETTNRVTDWFGAFSDAGDWDFHNKRHLPSIYQLLDVYEHIPATQRDIDYGFPKSSQTIDRDLYSEADSLGCLVHMAIWYLDGFRRTQHADGWVYSGAQYSDGAEDDTDTPSWLSQNNMYLLAADEWSTMYYAWVAGKLARILDDAGATTIAATWKTSAENAFNWADGVLDDWYTNGLASTGAWRDHYITKLDMLSSTNVNKGRLAVMAAETRVKARDAGFEDGPRLPAATTIWRANGGISDSWNTIIKDYGNIGQSGLENYAAWEYHKGPDLGDNTTVRNNISDVNSRADAVRDGAIAGDFPYRNIPITDTSSNNIQPSEALYELFWPYWEQQPTGDYEKYLKAICSQTDYVHGANQLGMCFTTGIGHNTPDPILIRDIEHAGIAPIPGITIYVAGGPSGYVEIQYATGYVQQRASNATNEKQAWYPYFDAQAGSWPKYERHTRNTFSIYSTEFVTQRQIVGSILNNIVIHAWDETGTVELVDASKPGVLSL